MRRIFIDNEFQNHIPFSSYKFYDSPHDFILNNAFFFGRPQFSPWVPFLYLDPIVVFGHLLPVRMPGYTRCGARFPRPPRTGEQEDVRSALHSKSDITKLDLTLSGHITDL